MTGPDWTDQLGDRRARLRADCAHCVALCCVAPAFAASRDFAIDKPARHPCPNLVDFTCGIHDRLRERGFPGCVAYDCFGAGQQVTQVTFAGHDWQADGIAEPVFAAFEIMRSLHELLWYLTEAASIALSAAPPSVASSLAGEVDALIEHIEAVTRAPRAELLTVQVPQVRASANELLLRASEAVRHGGRDLRGADLAGRNLRRADLRSANLRGALLIGANLAGADLRGADVIGADFRGADLAGADLRDTLFLVQAQLEAAAGDAATLVPVSVRRPAHW